MENQYQRPKGPDSAPGEQPKSPQSIDKNGQHIAHCLFRERGFEPWPKKYLKYILMEWYIFLNERQCLPGTWDCPLPSCDKRNGTFRDIIIHLDDCHHLKDNTRQYTCPGCQTNVEIDGHTCPGCQTMGHGRKTMLKIKSSFESLLGHCSPRVRTSSAGSSPTSPLPPDLGSSNEKAQALAMSYAAIDPNLNARTPNLFSQNNRNVSIVPIDTQCNQKPMYEACARPCCVSSTATNSSYGSELCSVLSSQGASSAASSSQYAWSATAELPPSELSCFGDTNVSPWANDTQPTCNVQHFGALPFASTLSELPGNVFFQDVTNIEGIMPCFPMDSHTNINFNDVEQGFNGEITNLPQDQWIQPEEILIMPELPGNSPQEYCDIMELASSAGLTHELSSPASTDVTMVDSPTTVDTPATSVGPSPPTSASSLLECHECQWKPDMKVNRPFKKLRLAVEKHVKRNHQSRNYECPICHQVFKNRPDNVKQHVSKKHPEKVDELYPKAAAAAAQQSGGGHTTHGEKVRAPALGKPATRRRASMPLPTSQASPTRGRHLRFSRG